MINPFLLVRQVTNITFCESLHIVIRRFSTTKRWPKIKRSNEIMIPCRDDPVITKLDTPEFHSIFTPELDTLANLFKRYSYDIRIAGGAVRDILMGMKPQDLDFATDATPDQMKDMFKKENIRMINMKGEKHGTITSRINDKQNFEITTLRIDILTDGRHAEVEFTKDWKSDAHRRDLTVNSMFLDLDGNVYDYFYGYDDLKKRRIRFVGDAATRIQEDYLRIFRYFRFHGRISENPELHEESTITAIRENVDGLERISGERIWSEWVKILNGKCGGELTLKMLECGVTKYVGLPKEPNIDHFKEVYYRSIQNNVKLRPISLISSLLENQEEVMELHKRLKLSAFDRDLALFLVIHRERKPCEKPLKPYQSLVVHLTGKVPGVREYVCEVLKYNGLMELLHEFEQWVLPKFPITGNQLKQHVPIPKMMTPLLKELKDIWLDNNCNSTAEELMNDIPRIVADIQDKIKS